MFDGQKGGSQGRGLVIEMQPRKNPSAHILLFFSCINNSYVNSRIRDMRLECECFMAKSNCIPSEDLEVQVNCGLLFLTDREYLPCIASVYLSFVLSFFHFFIDFILSVSKLSFILQFFLYALGLYRQLRENFLKGTIKLNLYLKRMYEFLTLFKKLSHFRKTGFPIRETGSPILETGSPIQETESFVQETRPPIQETSNDSFLDF